MPSTFAYPLHYQGSLSRRSFLKLAALGLGTIAVPGWAILPALADFPNAERLGRACSTLEIKSQPDPDSQSLGVMYEDTVVPWRSETISKKPNYIFNNQRWVEIPEGFVYAPQLQPVKNLPNQPLVTLPSSTLGVGMWVEVTVPYVDVTLQNSPSSHSWVEAKVDAGLPLRFYYSQVFWVDQINTSDSGQVFYRVNPNYYGGVDMLWAPAEAFRPLNAEDFSPINPDSEDKRLVVDVSYQTLSCYEGNQEVYFCRVSTGAKFNMYGQVVDKWATPVGRHRISRKFISLQMSGGTTGAGYDLPGIGWVSIFATGGVAIHSTFWHNNFGDPMSHGCVNVAPEDSKWIFRWSMPTVATDPGMVDITQTGQASTQVDVIEA